MDRDMRLIATALAQARAEERERCAALASDTYNALLIAAKGHDECGDYALGRRARDEARGVSRVEKRIPRRGAAMRCHTIDGKHVVRLDQTTAGPREVCIVCGYTPTTFRVCEEPDPNSTTGKRTVMVPIWPSDENEE